MKRNMEQIAKSAVINTNYEVSSKELLRLIEMAKSGTDGAWDALVIAFKYGYVLGGRAEKKAAKMKQQKESRISV